MPETSLRAGTGAAGTLKPGHDERDDTRSGETGAAAEPAEAPRRRWWQLHFRSHLAEIEEAIERLQHHPRRLLEE